MKYKSLMVVLSTTFLVNCSTHPEIKPYEEKELLEEAVKDESLPYGQSISDAVFSDSSIAYDESEVPTEFDDSIDDAQDVAEEFEPPKKDVVAKKTAKNNSRSPASAGKNGLRTFSADCVMKSQPDDASSNMGNVSKGKKLWLDQHSATWFKAYKKSGTVYVPSSCVQ